MTEMNGPPGASSTAAGHPNAPPSSGPPAIDAVAVMRSKPYFSALLLAAVLGVPISAVAYGFLALVTAIQEFLFQDLPGDVFESGAPAWWPVPWLVICGLLTGLTIRYLPGNGGHSPAFGFHTGGGPPVDRELPAIILAALTTLSLGAVLGPEAPLIAIGGGLAALTVHLANKNAPPMAQTVMASAGSFAAISTLLGSPVLDPLSVGPAVLGAVRSVARLGDLGVPGMLSSKCGDGPCCAAFREDLKAPMPPTVRAVSVYSRSDGIVSWEACLDRSAEHVEVESSHCGMSVNVEVYRVLAKVLGQEASRWTG